MISYLEAGDRVFRLETTPDEPGHIRRRVSLSLESGPDLTDAEWRRVVTEVVADAVARGIDVRGWAFPSGDDTSTS